jgi:hypothetical protein
MLRIFSTKWVQVPSSAVAKFRGSKEMQCEAGKASLPNVPTSHRAKLHSTNPIERLDGEIKRRTEVVGIFPNETAIRRLVGAILLEQNDEWAVQRARYMTLETIAPALRSAIAPSSQPSYPPPPATACPPSRHCCTRIPEQDAVTRPLRRTLRAAPRSRPALKDSNAERKISVFFRGETQT